MTLYQKYLGPGFDSRHLHQLFNNMQKLFENWRKFKNEVQDPDSDSDDSAELKNMAPEINREFIEKIIGDFSFNSAQSSQHRWSPRQPIIDYYFDERIGSWKYTATIPDGTNNADKWPTIKSNEKEDLGAFLQRVETSPHQLSLFENWREFQKCTLNESALKLAIAADRARHTQDSAGDIEDPKADKARALQAVIDANEKKIRPGLAELIETIIAKVSGLGLGVLAGSSVGYKLKKIGISTATRRFMQKAIARFVVPGVGVVLFAEDLYDYVLSPEAEENRAEVIKDFKKVLYVLDYVDAQSASPVEESAFSKDMSLGKPEEQ